MLHCFECCIYDHVLFQQFVLFLLFMVCALYFMGSYCVSSKWKAQTGRWHAVIMATGNGGTENG